MKRIGVIGCGGRLRSVISHIPQLGTEIELVAAYDPDVASIRALQKEFNLDKLRICSSYQELVALPELDWVLIGSWNCFHSEQAIAAFRAGKHVFCEKPLAITADQCLAMIQEWKKSGKIFFMGFNMRYSPLYRKIKEVISSGKIGKIISLEFNETLNFSHGGFIHGNWRRHRKNAGTHLLEKCCHDLDLINWLVGVPAKRVSSFGGTNFFLPDNKKYQELIGLSSAGKKPYQDGAKPGDVDPFTRDKDIFDNQVAIIEYENQVRAVFHTNCNSGIPERRLYVCGTEGGLRAGRTDQLDSKIEVKRIGWDTEMETINAGQLDGHAGGDQVLGLELGTSILNTIQPACSGDDGLRSAFTAFAIDEACDTGKVVELSSLWQRYFNNPV